MFSPRLKQIMRERRKTTTKGNCGRIKIDRRFVRRGARVGSVVASYCEHRAQRQVYKAWIYLNFILVHEREGDGEMEKFLIASTVTLLIDFVLRGAQRQKRRFHVWLWWGRCSWRRYNAALPATNNKSHGNSNLMNSFSFATRCAPRQTKRESITRIA